MWDNDYLLYDENKNYPLKFTYNSNSDIYWRFDLKDIPLFIHNIWWDSILILLKLYNLTIWDSKVSEASLNEFRLKTIVLQLLGGFSSLNMFDKLNKFFKDHYTINNNNYKNILIYEKKLNKLSVCQDDTKLSLGFDHLILNVVNQFNLTIDLNSRIESIIYGEQQEIIEDPYDDIDFKIKNREKQKELTLDVKNIIEKSNKEFQSNYQFNLMLNFILSLEVIIKIICNIINKNIEVNQPNKIYLNKLENVLFTLIIHYKVALESYNESYIKFSLNNIKINNLSLNLELLNNLEKNKSFEILLVFSDIGIKYNSPSQLQSVNKKNGNHKKEIKINLNRKYSTLIPLAYNHIINRKFTTSIIQPQNRKSIDKNKDSLTQDKPKTLNYNK